MAEDKIMTAEEIVKYLRISRKTITKLLMSGEIPGHKFGDQWRILKSEVDSYMKRKEKDGGKIS